MPPFPPKMAKKRLFSGSGSIIRAHLACGRFSRKFRDSIKQHVLPLARRVWVGYAG
jgi:hypothetical protein